LAKICLRKRRSILLRRVLMARLRRFALLAYVVSIPLAVSLCIASHLRPFYNSHGALASCPAPPGEARRSLTDHQRPACASSLLSNGSMEQATVLNRIELVPWTARYGSRGLRQLFSLLLPALAEPSREHDYSIRSSANSMDRRAHGEVQSDTVSRSCHPDTCP
jgi:hypothetical protein